MEDKIRKVFVSHIPGINWDRTLIENGADSLIVNELVMDLEDEFDVEIPTDWVAKDPVKELVDKIVRIS